MNKKNAKRLGWLAIGLMACLTVSAAPPATDTDVTCKLDAIIIPKPYFRPPATIADAVDFFIQASRDYDHPSTPLDQRGVSFMLRLPRAPIGGDSEFLPFKNDVCTNCCIPQKQPFIHTQRWEYVSLRQAVEHICELSGMKMNIRRGAVCIESDTGEIELPTRLFDLSPSQRDMFDMLRKLTETIIPEVSFRAPDTIIDAVNFFTQASRDHGDQRLPAEQRGINFMLTLPRVAASDDNETDNPFGGTWTNTVPTIPALSARFISLYDALRLVCDATAMEMSVRGSSVHIRPKGVFDPDEDWAMRSLPLKNVNPATNKESEL